jgi:FixJ family two-component response regulator
MNNLMALEQQADCEKLNLKTIISVVDDDESVRDSFRSLLRSAGYEVEVFESSEVFLESGAASQSGCLILDIRMPGMNGLELQRQLNLSHSKVPIIFVTSYDDTTHRQLAMDEGASDFFHKPVPASNFLRAIETALENRRGAGGS